MFWLADFNEHFFLFCIVQLSLPLLVYFHSRRKSFDLNNNFGNFVNNAFKMQVYILFDLYIRYKKRGSFQVIFFAAVRLRRKTVQGLCLSYQNFVCQQTFLLHDGLREFSNNKALGLKRSS